MTTATPTTSRTRRLPSAAGAEVDLWLPDDFGDICSVLLAVQKRSQYQGLAVSKPAMFNTLMGLQRHPDQGRVFVVRDRRGRARSILAAGAYPYWFADPVTGPRYASDVIFVSTIPGAGLLLLRALEWWASREADRVVSIDLEITSDIHPERTRQFYLDAGYRETGSQFVKPI